MREEDMAQQQDLRILSQDDIINDLNEYYAALDDHRNSIMNPLWC